jgi:murein DD-endopeptidase MepM/ murein hydrolase activator NlpD
VPGGSKPFIPRAVTAYTGPIPEGASSGSGAFAWPTSGTIYQGFFPWHPAIDIAAYIGAPILAADSGYVIVSGWSNVGYGYYVVIDHSNGFQTMYAHLNAIYVNVGENVAIGQQIGEMGITGNATGPHLHFDVHQNTVVRNQIGMLP